MSRVIIAQKQTNLVKTLLACFSAVSAVLRVLPAPVSLVAEIQPEPVGNSRGRYDYRIL